MSGVKAYIIWEGEGDAYPEKKSKMAVPKTWLQRPVSDVIGLFVKAYNEKNAEQPALVVEELHLVSVESKEKIYSDALVLTSLGDHCDYLLKRGAHRKAEAQGAADSALTGVEPGSVKCKNYGCQKMFVEELNTDTACHHHTGPPIFHDTMKCWSCCRERKAYDFESFQLIAPCAVGRHSTVDPKVAISESPRQTVFAGAEGSGSVVDNNPQPVLKSIADYNSSNSSAPTAAASAVKTISVRKSSRNADGVTAKCQRKGCQKTFSLAENGPSACSYHRGQPVFHDAVKYWSCCDHKKCMDFDEFLGVPGCAVGLHDDGEIEL